MVAFLQSRDMKKFLKNLLRNWRSDFEIISQECSLSDPSQKVLVKFWSIVKHGSSERGLFSLYMDMKKLLKNLLWNHWSDIEMIS